jgi:hypothetical protein
MVDENEVKDESAENIEPNEPNNEPAENANENADEQASAGASENADEKVDENASEQPNAEVDKQADANEKADENASAKEATEEVVITEDDAKDDSKEEKVAPKHKAESKATGKTASKAVSKVSGKPVSKSVAKESDKKKPDTEVIGEDAVAPATVEEGAPTPAKPRNFKDIKLFGKVPALFVALGALGLVLIVALSLVVVGLVNKPGSLEGFFKGDYTKENIAEVGLYQTNKVSEITDKAAELKFKNGNPIILTFKYDAPDETTTYTYKVTKARSDDALRSGSVPVKAKTDEAKDGVKYISIVSSKRTALEDGEYVFALEDGNGKKLAQRTFTVLPAEG